MAEKERIDYTIVDLAEQIVHNVYAAGTYHPQIGTDDKEYASQVGVKTFHFSRACDLASRFVKKIGDETKATQALTRVLYDSEITVIKWQFRGPETELEGLVSFLTGDFCDTSITEAFIKNFRVLANNPKILRNRGRNPARKSLGWLLATVGSVGGNLDCV